MVPLGYTQSRQKINVLLISTGKLHTKGSNNYYLSFKASMTARSAGDTL